MLRKIFKTVASSAAMVAFLASTCFAFTEGTDYVKLEKPIPNVKNTLVKVWSYDCPFCYKYDKQVTPKVVPKLAKNVTFRPFHLKTKGKYGVQGSELFAALMVKDFEKGLNDRDLNDINKSLFKKAKMAHYNAYHDKKERWDAGPDAYLKTGLDAVGMTGSRSTAACVSGFSRNWISATAPSGFGALAGTARPATTGIKPRPAGPAGAGNATKLSGCWLKASIRRAV